MKLYASGEDYLETILALQKRLGTVRSVSVARHLKASKPSVCHAVAILWDGSLLTTDEDRLPVQSYLFFLTELPSLSLKWPQIHPTSCPFVQLRNWDWWLNV